MMPTISHLSGPYITLSGRLIQRCAICGEKLRDSKNEVGPTRPDGSPPIATYWPVLKWVRVTTDENPQRSTLVEIEDGMIPGDACDVLLED